MNRANLEQTIALMEQWPEHFFMPVTILGGTGPMDDGPMCGTVGCIAGFACVAAGDDVEELAKLGDMEVLKRAAKYLGLDEPEATYIFMGRWAYNGMQSVTHQAALDYLKSRLEY